MSTKFLSPGWRMPRNANQGKNTNYSMFGTSSQKIDASNVPLGSESWTIAVWYKQSNSASNYIFWDMQYGSAGGLKLIQQGGTGGGTTYAYFLAYGPQYFNFQSQKVITEDNWHHVIVRYNKNVDYRIYVDGILSGITTNKNTYSWPATRNLELFKTVVDVHLDQFCVFDYALSDTSTTVGDTATGQIATLWGGGTAVSNPMALPSPPKVYYPLGKSTWNGNFLSENNAIGDYVFDFNTDYIDCGNDSSLQIFTGSHSVSAWIYFSSAPSEIDHVYCGYGLVSQMALTSSRTIRYYNLGLTTGTDMYSSTALNTNSWNHVVCTYEVNGNKNIYINGVAETPTSTSGSITSTSVGFMIGARNSTTTPDRNFDGKLSNVQIFNTALRGIEVETLYNYGSPIRTLANIPQSSNLKAWYKLDASEIYNSVSTEWEVSDATAAIKNTILDPANSNPRPYFEENTPGNLLSLTGTAGQSITISLWYYASGNADNILFNKVENGAYWFGKQTSNNLRFLFTNSSLWTLGPSVPRNQWNHIVLTVTESGTSSGRTVKFYVNGGSPTTVTDSSSSLIDLTSQKNTFGASSYSSTNVDVLSSNYIYYNTALSDSEVVSLYNSFSPDSENTPTVQPALSSFPRNSNITGWFKSDGLDSSGQGNNGSAEGSILLGPAVSLTNGKSSGMSQANLVQSDLQTVAPYSKYAMRFDAASSDYIQTTFNPYTSIGDNTSWTVSSWVYVSNVTTQQKILGIYDTTRAARFWFGIVNGGILFGYGNRGVYPISGTSVSANSWQNIIVTYSTTTGYILVYVNASINGTYDYAGNSGNGIIANANITIGDAIGESTFVNGYISNISIWNAELTSAQVREIYNEGLPSNLNSHSAYSNLVAWWQLGENSSFTNNWIVADEKGTNNGESQNMGVDALVNGVGTTANGISSGMSEGNLVGDAPYSTANAISSGMAVTARGTDVP